MPGYQADPQKVRAYAVTGREVEVLCLLAEGLNSKEIGNRLGIEGTTVRDHVSKIGDKLGVRGAAMVLQAAHEAGLLRRVVT